MSLPEAVLEALRPYEGDASDMMFYVTTAGWGLHGQVLYQYRDADGRWRYGNIDDMGFMPESAGSHTKSDLRGCKPYFTTKRLEDVMPHILDLKSRWMSRHLHDFGLDPVPVVTSQEPMFVAAVRFGGGALVMSSRTLHRGEVRVGVTRLDPVGGVFRTDYYHDGSVGFPRELERIPDDDAPKVIADILDGWWEDRMYRIRRLYVSSVNAKVRAKAVQTVSETAFEEDD